MEYHESSSIGGIIDETAFAAIQSAKSKDLVPLLNYSPELCSLIHQANDRLIDNNVENRYRNGLDPKEQEHYFTTGGVTRSVQQEYHAGLAAYCRYIINR